MKVTVAIYGHKYGETVRVFESEDSPDAWKTEIGKEWWATEFPHTPQPADDVIGEAYFAAHQESGLVEWFTTQTVEVEP